MLSVVHQGSALSSPVVAGRPSNADRSQKLLRARRGSGHNMSFKRSFKLKRPDDGGGSQFSAALLSRY